MPVLIAEKEWEEINAGLIERADLLEQVVADIYGDNQLVADGHLPAELVAGNPEWLRPLVGVKPRSGHFLHFVAFDIGRGPKGQWWVIGDPDAGSIRRRLCIGKPHRNRSHLFRTFCAEQRPSPRLVFPVHSGDRLQDMREGVDSRVGILTLMNDTYFEHAYIARYLGFMLLEGEDLTMRDGHLMVRTVAGLKPVNVLWRRLDASWADPLNSMKIQNKDSRIAGAFAATLLW